MRNSIACDCDELEEGLGGLLVGVFMSETEGDFKLVILTKGFKVTLRG